MADCPLVNASRQHTRFLIGFVAIASRFVFSIRAAFAEPWNPDLGDGRYKNPIVFADYSDPDVIRVGDDFYLTASSFNCVPGLPILHSRDLVHWRIINYALPRLYDEAFDRPQHGNGVWAPSIRFHDGQFYIYWGDPDRGIYMVRAKDPAGTWSEPMLVKKAIGNIDPCPLWDDDGKAYLVHAFAHSRSGVKSLLQVDQLAPDGTRVLDKGTIVFDGHKNHPTIEGPKFTSTTAITISSRRPAVCRQVGKSCCGRRMCSGHTKTGSCSRREKRRSTARTRAAMSNWRTVSVGSYTFGIAAPTGGFCIWSR
jgi:hypothetical protein